MSESRVLVTGANGFVGTRICHRFIQEGFDVKAGVRRSSVVDSLESMKLEMRYGDVTDTSSLEKMVAGVDYVIHNAGLVKARKPKTFFDVNEQGTRNLLEAVQRSNPGVKRVVLISSLAAIGPSSQDRPVHEDDTPQPMTTYGMSKLAGEKVAREFASNLPVSIVRPPGVYGPGDIGFLDFFKSVRMGLGPLVGNPNRRIQLVHVDDLARGIFLATTTDTESGLAFFIAESKSYSAREIMNAIEEACQHTGIKFRLPGSLFKTIATVSESVSKALGATPMLTKEKARELLQWWEVSTERAEKLLSFRAQIPFPEGARQTYQWYRRQGWVR